MHVLWEIDQHRTWPTRARQAEGLRKDARDVLGRGQLEGALGDRPDHAQDVDFLECLGADCGPCDLTRQGHHRDAVHERGRQTGQQVCGAGTTRGDAHAHPAGGAGVAVGGVGGVLLVTNQHVAQLRIAGELAVERQRGSAWVAEQRGSTGGQ